MRHEIENVNDRQIERAIAASELLRRRRCPRNG